MTPLATHMSRFIYDHLPRNRGLSTQTVDTYATGLAVLLRFAAERLRTEPSQLNLEQIDSDLVLGFLECIEERGATVRTRNARLAAIKAFFKYVEWKVPAALEQVRRIRAIPNKRTETQLVAWLTIPEIDALLAAPNPRTVDGIRDRAMLALTYTCGLRVSELIALSLDDYDRSDVASIRVLGKGRRERMIPLSKEVERLLNDWLRLRDPSGDAVIFQNRSGRRLTRAGFQYILDKHVAEAEKAQPSIAERRVTPHVLRHSCAMHTYQATGDVRSVSLWLGHASLLSTQVYVRADPTEKLRMLEGTRLPNLKPGRFRPGDSLIAMLKGANRR